MNRKERRAARKQSKGTLPRHAGLSSTAVSKNLFADAVQSYRSGRYDDAERLCRDALMLDPNRFEALHLLGVLAAHAGNYAGAAEIMGQSLEINERNHECHYHLGDVLRTLGRNYDAVEHLTRATVLKPDYIEAYVALGGTLAMHNDLDQAQACFERALTIDAHSLDALNGAANVALLQGRMEDAAVLCRALLARQPSPEAHSNLGLALANQERFSEAAEQYRQALALKPDLVDVYRNLALALMAMDQPAQALAAIREGFRHGETHDARLVFTQCVSRVPEPPLDDDLRTLLARALLEGWVRVTRLSGLAADMVKRFAASRANGSGTDGMADDFLLRALLVSAAVPDAEMERRLTAMRSTLLQQALAAPAEGGLEEPTFVFCCALARQCFINEYVFAETDADLALAAQLRERIESALAAGAPVSPLWIAALACYTPLGRLSNAQALLAGTWPDALVAAIDQQVREPQLERELRAKIPALTTIDDEISRKVQQQYEEMPYPRWVRTSRPNRQITIDEHLRTQFPRAPFQPYDGGDGIDILIAGCGTGQHAIETAQRYAGSRVLAIDLSLTSLGYASRKTQEHGLRGIGYAQADILKLGELNASFDVIEAIGSLQCLTDIMHGWRILVSALRPNGFMHLGLYSVLARASVRAARQFIAERGYGDTADDIRRCRQELLATPEGTLLNDTTRFTDFYTISECRDLLFHVQETQVTIPQIKAFLEENRLTFIGFSGLVNQAYRTRFPEDPAMTDLDRWLMLEQESPRTFAGMYQFWVQKAAD